MALIVGGPKSDKLFGNDPVENDIVGDALALDHSKGGNDILIGGAFATNHLNGDALTMTNSMGGNDILIGGANADGLLHNVPDNVLCGDSGDLSNPTGDMTNSTGGNDILTGGANAFNIVAGDTCNIMINSKGGNDILTGGANAHNILVGDARVMTNSTGGNDRLVSGANAKDEMWGDFADAVGINTGGHDTYAFRPSNGTDYVYDLHHGEDIIELGGFYSGTSSALASFSDLNIETDGVNSSILFDATNSITVVGVTNLTASDFLFVI